MNIEDIIVLTIDGRVEGPMDGPMDIGVIVAVDHIVAIAYNYSGGDLLGSVITTTNYQQGTAVREKPIEILQKIHDLKNKSNANNLISNRPLDREVAEFKEKISRENQTHEEII